MRRLTLSLIIACATASFAQLSLSEGPDSSAGDLECYIIHSPVATYYFEKLGAGLSSMVDTKGNDWLSFKPDKGSGVEGEFRGFPNAVSGFFHPKNNGTGISTVTLVTNTPQRVTLRAATPGNKWIARWDFYPSHLEFTMEKANGTYWVLYEGTPGGKLTKGEDWYLYSGKQQKTDAAIDFIDTDLPGPVEWMAFGDSTQNNDAVLLVNHTDDNHIDNYQTYNKMTVFGFGRRGVKKLLTDAPRTFSMTLVPNATYEKLSTLATQIVGGTVATAPTPSLLQGSAHTTAPIAPRIQLSNPQHAPAMIIQNGTQHHTLSGQVVR